MRVCSGSEDVDPTLVEIAETDEHFDRSRRMVEGDTMRRLAWVAAYKRGLLAYDISDPLQPVKVFEMNDTAALHDFDVTATRKRRIDEYFGEVS